MFLVLSCFVVKRIIDKMTFILANQKNQWMMLLGRDIRRNDNYWKPIHNVMRVLYFGYRLV